VKRRIAAIMVGDIVGYSTMMEKSEEKTVARLATCQALISKKVASLDGRIFNMAGDATLAEFPSPINALRCAVEIGVALAGADGSEVEPLKMRFGLHLADVAVRGDDLVGDGVNLAARIQQAAAPGSVWVSGVGGFGSLEREDHPSLRGSIGCARRNGVENRRDGGRADGGRKYSGGATKAT
jgi:class 3 adenylate cyclase